MQSLKLHQTPTAGPLIEVNNSPLLMMGTSVPADGTSGYQKGCIYIKTDGGAGTTLYINEGTAASCDFNAK